MKQSNIREMLKALGSKDFGATLAMPMMFMLPRTTQPMADSTIVIVQGVQRGLNRLGWNVPVDGMMDERTKEGLRRVSGNGWDDKSWVQIYGDLIAAKKAGYRLDKKQTPVASNNKEKSSIVPIVLMLAGGVLILGAMK